MGGEVEKTGAWSLACLLAHLNANFPRRLSMRRRTAGTRARRPTPRRIGRRTYGVLACVLIRESEIGVPRWRWRVRGLDP